MSYSGPQEYLDSFLNFEIHRPPALYQNSTGPAHTFFKLKRIRELLKLIGNPHLKLKCLHVAGSKGKGSTCVFVASILQSTGYTVGLYTSPHLFDYKERIRILSGINRREEDRAFTGKVTQKALKDSLKEIKSSIEIIRANRSLGQLTYFEVLTVLALYHFYKQKVDFVVLETGLGGRLDATNVVEALVSAITPISLEHTDFLGKTIKKIAKEKAGIIKSRSQSVVIAPQNQEALNVIQDKCRRVGASFSIIGRDITFRCKKTTLAREIFSIKGQESYPDLQSRLIGPHQVVNAAVAIGMIESLSRWGFHIGRKAISAGIRNTVWPGRFEVIGRKPLIILDGAHNAASCQVLTETIKKVLPNKKVILILGVSSDKDIHGIARELAKISRLIIATQANHPRAHEFKSVESERLFPGQEVILSKNVRSALQLAKEKSTSHEVIVVTGSLFVVGEARKLCINTKV